MHRAPRAVVITLITLLMWLSVAEKCHAQQALGLRRIGVVAIFYCEESDEATAFRNGLHDAGYAEGRDISISWWCGHGSYEHVAEAAADLVQGSIDVIVVEGTMAALAAKRATGTIPIVMALVGDPVGSGLVASLAWPGGNVTGLTNQTVDLVQRRLQLLKEAIPSATRVAVLFNPDTPYTGQAVARLQSAAPRLGVELRVMSVRRAEETRTALSGLSRSQVDALMPLDDAFMTSQIDTILQIASRAGVPVVYADKPLARKGVLLSYAVRHSDLFRRAASYVDKVLKGTPPASLPVEQPTRFELVVNLKTAQALGLTIPPTLLFQADEVIR
jgi:putative ABC transport system substrate-binding protein